MEKIDTRRIADIIRHVADTEIRPRFKNIQAGEFREKDPGDYVTIADEASETALTRLLSEALPGALVVGEEAVSKDESILDRFRDSRPVWIIDPIDGTYNFLHGRSIFGVLVALVRDGVTQYGWAYDVPGDRMAHAARGGGAFLNEQPIRIEPRARDMKDMVGRTCGAQAWHFGAITPHVKSLTNGRCSLFDYLSILTGEADFILHTHRLNPWDHAAGVLIVEEAGAYVALEDGGRYDPSTRRMTPMVTAPSREWWEKLCPFFMEKMAERRREKA